MSKFVVSFFACLLGLSLNGQCAVTPEDKQALIAAYKPVITECSQTYGVTDEDIHTAKEKVSAEGIAPCFFGCAFKKLEIINGEGKVDVPVALSKLKKFVKDDGDFAKFEEIGNKCASVNDESVSDPEAGCERAQLLLKCFVENKAELPL